MEVKMRRLRKMSMEEMVSENKKMLLNDKEALEKIDKKIEDKRATK